MTRFDKARRGSQKQVRTGTAILREMHPEHRPLSQYRQWLDHLKKSCQPFIDHLIEEDRKKALARKAEEAERLANENRLQAEERERYKAVFEGAIKLAMELERKVDEN